MLDVVTRQMLYPAPPFRVPPPQKPLDEVTLVAGGDDVVAWTWTAATVAPETPAVVFLHGNGENLATMEYAGLFEDLRRLEIPFVAVDYPGYGRSRGRPSEDSLVSSAMAGLAWLRERHPERPIALVGWSLGAAVAIQAAARSAEADEADRRGIERLVLMSAWDDLPTLASVHFPGWLVRAGLSDTYDSVAAARELQCPVLMLHGTDDTVIPIEHGRRLAATFGGRARFVEVPRTGHNDLLGRPEVWTELERFLKAPAEAPGARL